MAMKIFKKKENWLPFIVKCSIALILITLFWAWFTSRFIVGIDSQKETSLVGYNLFIIDTQDKVLKKGKVYAYLAQGLEPLFPDGTKLVKYLEGMPGDEIKITSNETIYVNDEPVAYGLALAQQLQIPKESFQGEKKLENNEYWVMGTSPISFDSRYFGTIKNEQIIGRTYPLF